MKINIVLQPDKFSSFTSYYLEPLWNQYFNIEVYDQNKQYDKNTLFVFWWLDSDNKLISELYNDEHKVVIDNLWETANSEFDKFYQLNNRNWFWWNESLWWRSMGYSDYVPDKTYKKLALMLIRRVSPIRDQIVKNLGPWLDRMIWSYRDKLLPDDQCYENGDVNQRHMNPAWYNDAIINLVVESAQHGQFFWATDKTYKACAYYQPFLIIGQTHTLAFLKSQGFETFDNIFDETYDQESNFEKRLSLILKNLDRITHQPYSKLTWQKLQHNHNHFFNEQLCKQGIVKEIIEPLLHYAET